MTSTLKAWARALVVTLTLVMLVVVAVMVYAGVVIAIDESSHGEDWDGFGTFLGLIALGIGAVHLLVLGGLRRLTRLARINERRWAVVLAAVLAALVALPWFVLVLSEMTGPSGILVVGIAPASLFVVSLGTLVAAVQPAQKPLDQPPAWPQPPKSS